MNVAAQLKAKAIAEFENNLQHIDKTVALFDIGIKIATYWGELVGEEVKPAIAGYNSVIITLSMGHKMLDGKYPSKSLHLGLLREYADELLEEHFAFDDFKVNHDQWSSDLLWGNGYTASFKIYANHGGDCTYKQVGTKTVEQPIYEMECN